MAMNRSQTTAAAEAELAQLRSQGSTINVPTQIASDELLTVREVAKILRVDDTTVRRWVKQGALEAVVLPHVNRRQAYRIKQRTVEALLNTSFTPQQ
jgi:excisionase family DNA binding protein